MKAMFLAWLLLGQAGPAQAPAPVPPEGLEPAIRQRIAANQAARQAQVRIDRLDDETQTLVERYRLTLSRIDAAQRYVDQMEKLVADQEAEIESYKDRLERVGETKRELVPLLLEMIDHLDAFIRADTPFLLDSRLERVDALRKAMDRADVPTAEKARLVLQAYRIEANYGTGLDAYEGALPTDPNKRVEFLRIGRVALIYRTVDGREMAFWDQASGDWQPLGGDYRRELEQAYRIARRQAAPSLLVLPTPAPEIAP